MTKQSKVVMVVDPSTDRAHRHIDNGVFLDGRTKTLKGYGLTQQQQIALTARRSLSKIKRTIALLIFASKRIIITTNGWNVN